jgi:uncharacterized delta-60 repeat protein
MNLMRNVIILALVAVPFVPAYSDCPPALSWALAYSSPGKSAEVFYSVAPDGEGGAVCAGYEVRPDLKQGRNWLVARYGADGKMLWATSYDDATHGDDAAQAVAVDGAGNITVAGWEDRRDRSSFSDVLVQRHAPDGKILWSRGYDGPAHGNDRAYAVCVEPSGAVVVAGTESFSGGSRWLVLKYSPKGALLWSRTCGVGVGLSATARAVAMDLDGGLVVAGSQQVGGFNYDWAVRKFSPAGELKWTITMGGSGGGWDEASAVAPYPDGGVLVAGRGQLGGPGSRYQWLVARLGPDGKVLWSRTGPGIPGGDARAFAVVVDGCGLGVVSGCDGAGPSAVPGAGVIRVAEYSPAGDILCTWTAGSQSGAPAGVFGSGLDRAGGVFLAGMEGVGPGSRDVDAQLTRLARPPCPAQSPAVKSRPKR